jgi:hypothetical protein
MEVFPASVVLIVRALVINARWAGRQRRVTLERMAAAAEASHIAELEARVLTMEDRLELREAHIGVLESRLGEECTRKPYPLMERLRIIWLMEYFEIPQRRLEQTLGVSRSSVRRWLCASRSTSPARSSPSTRTTCGRWTARGCGAGASGPPGSSWEWITTPGW